MRRDLLFPRVIVEFTQLRFTSCSRWNRLGLASFHLGQTARELGFYLLFSATLILGSILVDLGELELHAVDDAVPTLDHGFVVCSSELIDHVLVLLNLLDLGVDSRHRGFEVVELLEIGAVARGSLSSGDIKLAHPVNEHDDQG